MRELNRFPKMMVLQYQRAKALGYDENQAKMIGYAQALKYAIFKTKRWLFSPKKKKSTSKNSRKNQPFKIKVNPIFNLYFVFDFVPYVGGKLIKIQDFDHELWKKNLSEKEKEILLEWAKNIISIVPKEILKNEQRFFKEVWVKVRDEQPLVSFQEENMNKQN